ncbi:hypothetical protein [Sphaerospermopsis sp. FACHB-1194]|nr:hypothetical protein [Sphaerospermopsis sp. FACHB-1194]MBD2144799.1 hypothetical protein [Sphaerospermopsis sp. FACHB-1194]
MIINYYPITNHQSPITSHQSPITSHQSPITFKTLFSRRSKWRSPTT